MNWHMFWLTLGLGAGTVMATVVLGVAVAWVAERFNPILAGILATGTVLVAAALFVSWAIPL